MVKLRFDSVTLITLQPFITLFFFLSSPNSQHLFRLRFTFYDVIITPDIGSFSPVSCNAAIRLDDHWVNPIFMIMKKKLCSSAGYSLQQCARHYWPRHAWMNEIRNEIVNAVAFIKCSSGAIFTSFQWGNHLNFNFECVQCTV